MIWRMLTNTFTSPTPFNNCTQQARNLQTELKLYKEKSSHELSLAETKWHRADSELQELRKREAANKDQHERARHKWENSIDALANLACLC